MERTLRKACRYGDLAKFWRFVSKVGVKIYNYAERKRIKNQDLQSDILRSVGFSTIEEVN